MKQVISTEKRPIKLWLDDIEDGALTQAKNLANLPFLFKHVAIMPDSHLGYGMPIGGVIATEGVVIPNAVGVDIGCGMCAVKTTILSHTVSIEDLKRVFGGSKDYHGGIRSCIPVGFNHQSKKQDNAFMPSNTYPTELPGNPIVEQEYQSALKQLGTLGGGNHFIEIQNGSDGFIWLMIHSGSRNIGYKVAKHYNEVAITLNKKMHSIVPEKWELAFLPLDSDEGQHYLAEMNYCVAFALANRELMMSRVMGCVEEVFPDAKFSKMINVAHNYAARENHFGKNVMVHRKGATRAYNGQAGIIPGSQGSPSYIVMGKSNPESFNSCSHGAGRLMGRNHARRTLDFDAEKKLLDANSRLHSLRTKKQLDEAISAYKDISVVMANQADLVDIAVELKPQATLKG